MYGELRLASRVNPPNRPTFPLASQSAPVSVPSPQLAPPLPEIDTQAVNELAFQGERILTGNLSGIDITCSCFGGAIKGWWWG